MVCRFVRLCYSGSNTDRRITPVSAFEPEVASFSNFQPLPGTDLLPGTFPRQAALFSLESCSCITRQSQSFCRWQCCFCPYLRGHQHGYRSSTPVFFTNPTHESLHQITFSQLVEPLAQRSPPCCFTIGFNRQMTSEQW